MSYQKLLQQMIGVTLVMLLLVGCGAPAATPTPAVIVVTTASQPTPTPVPPTATPVPPTATPAPPTPTPIPSCPATIVSKNGIVLEIANVYFEEYHSSTVGIQTYPDWLDRLELYTELITIEIPFDTIIEMQRVTGRTFTVTLLSGETLEGRIGKYYEGKSHPITLFRGQTTVHGYASEWEEDFVNFTSVIFSRDEQGATLADVTAEDGSTIQISEPQCERTSRSPFSGTSPRESMGFQIGDSTLQIPLADIAKLMVGEEETTLTLRNGEELIGHIAPGYYLSGETTVFGLSAFFHASLSTEISSVVFH